jgi:hypothetical protein
MSSPSEPTASIEADSKAGPARGIRLLLSVLCLSIVPVELGWITPLDRQWGFTLWHYLPPALAIGLAFGIALWVTPPVRRQALRLIAAIPMDRRLGALLLVILPFALWPLRSRFAYGDSRIIYFALNADPAAFFFPDIGATFLLKTGYRIGHATGIGGLELVQAMIIVCGSLAIYAFYRAALLLAPDPQRALAIVGLVLASGMARIFTGHLEVYSFVLVSVGAYVWAALAFLRGRCSWVVPSLAFGLGLWVHIQYLFLIPSIMLLFVLAEPGGHFGAYMKRWVKAGLVTLAPTALFFVALVATDNGQDLEIAVAKMLRWSDVGPTPEGHEAWIRLWGGSGPGTLYAMLGRGHLKYLANSSFILAPWTGLLLTWLALRARRAFVASNEARFLLCACATSVLYALIVRPVYGPYDWDLFSMTAALLGLLAGHLLVEETSQREFADLSALVIGSATLFTLIPFLIVGVAPRAESGPFSGDLARPVKGESFEDSFNRQIEPWL